MTLQGLILTKAKGKIAPERDWFASVVAGKMPYIYWVQSIASGTTSNSCVKSNFQGCLVGEVPGKLDQQEAVS